MIACEVTGKGEQRKVVLTIPENSGWQDRFPKARADNGVTVLWWDFDKSKPIEKLKWDSRNKLLKLPIPFATEAKQEELKPKKTAAGVEVPGICIKVPPSTSPVPLGTLRVSKKSADLIAYAIGKLNEYIKYNKRGSGASPEGDDLWADLLKTTREKFSPEAVQKLGEAIEQLGAEIDLRLDAISEQVAAIATARSRIDFLRGLRQKWSIPGSTEPSDIDM